MTILSSRPCFNLLHQLELEYAELVRQSLDEATTQSLKHMDDMGAAQAEADGRVSKEHKYHKKREEKLKDLLRRAAKDKRESCSQLEIMQQEISVALAELQIAGDRIKSLEFEIEDITSRRKRDVHECCPDTSATFELERLRNKNEALEGSLSEARRDAREARESLGRETAASDLVAKQLETSHSRLLQAQTAMSECLEETAKLTRQLEDERAKSAALRRRAEAAEVNGKADVERLTQEIELLRAQRDKFAESSTATGAALRRGNRKAAASSLAQAIGRYRLKRISSSFIKLAAEAAASKAASPLESQVAELREKGLAAAEDMAQRLSESESTCISLARRLEATEAGAPKEEELTHLRNVLGESKMEIQRLQSELKAAQERYLASEREREEEGAVAKNAAEAAALQRHLEEACRTAERRADEAEARLSKLRSRTLCLYLANAVRKAETRARAEAYDRLWAASAAKKEEERNESRERAATHVETSVQPTAEAAAGPSRIDTQVGWHPVPKRDASSSPTPALQYRASWEEDIAALEASRDSTALPRLMQCLRIRIAEELYHTIEQLYRVVGADALELHGAGLGGVTDPPLTEVERLQFGGVVRDATAGTLKWLVLIYLRTYESIKALLAERDLVPPTKKSRKRSKHTASSAPSIVAADLASLKMGGSATPADKARAARTLRNRLISLIEDGMDVWMQRRRGMLPRPSSSKVHAPSGARKGAATLWHTCRGGKTMDFLGCELCATLTGAGSAKEAVGHEAKRRSIAFAAGALDAGAGPRQLWTVLRGSGVRFADASWSVPLHSIEEDMWKIAVLVRKGGAGLNLSRTHTQRKEADRRLLELLMLHLRTSMVTKGLEDDPPERLQEGAVLEGGLFRGIRAVEKASCADSAASETETEEDQFHSLILQAGSVD